MSYTAKDLAKLLHANPDLAIMGDGTISAPYDKIVDAVMGAAKAPKLTEHSLQALVFEECARRMSSDPDWAMVVAIPNGQYRPGQRMEPGISAGFPDIIVPMARRGYIGLALELKVTPNKPRGDQLGWHRRLRDCKWVVLVLYDDPQKVIDRIAWYLGDTAK